MQQATPQFTPRQMLEAGRQAETEGKLDFAVQFYLHLVEYYGQTPEAAEARTALTRLAGANRQQVWQATVASRQERYRSGRLLALLISLLGWLAVLGSLAVAAAGLGGPYFQIAALQQLEIGTDMLWRAPVAGLAGVVMVICGQVARALLEQANASRELLAIERARAGIEQS
jgi:hypothetical protein